MIHKILVIEKDIEFLERMKNLLVPLGYKVHGESASMDGLNLLEKEADDPFSLVVVNYHMPMMRGDEILERAGELSPETRRMIMADITDIADTETVINAVNYAGIHACLSIPFKDEDFISQVGYCCSRYARRLKQKNLKKTTARQNRQMYGIARSFKKKEQFFASQIKGRENRVRFLKSRLDFLKKRSRGNEFTLESFLKRFDSNPGLELLSALFRKLTEIARGLINEAVKDQGIVIPRLEEYGPGEDLSSEDLKLVEDFLSLVFKEGAADDASAVSENDKDAGDRILEVTVSRDMLEARLRIIQYDPDLVNMEAVRELLEFYNICFGLIDDVAVEEWLASEEERAAPLLIARGTLPKQPVNARVEYHFEVGFTNPGKILEDGSMDFRDRGDIPFVSQGTLLAEKQPMVEGVPGMTVTGEEIPVLPARDVLFEAGPGAVFSEDGLSIFADAEGQPHLDAKGNVSVFPEMHIAGDVDYKTGNIHFKGNITVAGTVRQGFSVTGATLTAGQIEGAEIELTGDLNVSNGITDAHLIRVQGSVQAKYVNNSVIRAFGDLIVQKEIIDSKILLSGACINETGILISSEVEAKGGMKGGGVGTEKSSPVRIRVGTEGHIQDLMEQVEKGLEENRVKSLELEKEIETLNVRDQKLHTAISEHAYAQDRSQVECRSVEKELDRLQHEENLAEVSRLTDQVKKMVKQVEKEESAINKAFEEQDSIAEIIAGKRENLKELEIRAGDLLRDKKALEDYAAREDALACVIVAKTMMPGSTVVGPKARLKTSQPLSRVKIQEILKGENEDGVIPHWVMDISNL